MCKEVIKIVEKNVANKNSKDEIRRELAKACSKVKIFAKKCKSFVDKYSDKIVDLIMKKMGPDEVCKELTFCVTAIDAESQDYDSGLEILGMAVETEKSEVKFKESAIQVKKPSETIQENPQCVICEFVMSKLKDELNDKSTDKEIEDALKNVCSKLPKSVTKSCQSLVDSYFNVLVALLEMQKPSEVCAVMKFCSGAGGIDVDDFEDLQEIKNVQENVYECAVCKGVVEGVSDIVDDPQTDVDLENFEEKVCELFAGKYKDKVRFGM